MEGLLSQAGRQIHRRRSWVFAIAIASVVCSVLLIAQGNDFDDGNSPPSSIESGKALELVNQELPVVSQNSVTYIFSHNTLFWNDTEFEQGVREALEGLDEITLGILGVSMAYDNPDDSSHLARHVSNDGHHVAVFVEFNGTEDEIEEEVENIKSAIEWFPSSADFEILVTGNLVINSDFDQLLEADQIRAEIIGIPISIIILLFVFGTLTASH